MVTSEVFWRGTNKADLSCHPERRMRKQGEKKTAYMRKSGGWIDRKDWSYIAHLCVYGRKEGSEPAFSPDTPGFGEHPEFSCMHLALKAMRYCQVRTCDQTHKPLNVHLALHYALRAKAIPNFIKFLLYMNCHKYRWLKIKLFHNRMLITIFYY